ncbi:hypothetical protein TeGR_g338 [Tetraparma gracilis]|uniref:Uncharacterized protein n=1 Tax=Tetraparma gracilis TaxID=2962635 RepID=A0ABQ6MU69_9STRA|nr:hypothetical protein TeGR_g338 [Tetraparma gracilis]
MSTPDETFTAAALLLHIAANPPLHTPPPPYPNLTPLNALYAADPFFSALSSGRYPPPPAVTSSESGSYSSSGSSRPSTTSSSQPSSPTSSYAAGAPSLTFPAPAAPAPARHPAPPVIPPKFQWKRYAALEAFLLLNKAEYQSQLNYTPAQKAYNNDLTTRLMEHAAAAGLSFHGSFTHAMVRDRIRCFYKADKKREDAKAEGAKAELVCLRILNNSH